jgi:hypothetical protein
MDDLDKGLYQKYIVPKADGSEIEPEAKHIILRYAKDDDMGRAARLAPEKFAYEIRNINKQFSEDLFAEIREVNRAIYQSRKPSNKTGSK